jgi:hypothetical protein
MYVFLWRRLDAPGHDACRLEQRGEHWLLDGTAVFLHDGLPARLDYQVVADAAWRSQSGQVRGWVGPAPVDLHIGRNRDRNWMLNGVPVSGLEACVDLDLGFTPATNLLPIRRLALAVGTSAQASAAWLDLTEDTLQVQEQRYERRSESTYWYESPRFGYTALLEVTAPGFIRDYPGLWRGEA